MKAILEFDLNEHHDKLAHNRAVKATNAYLALYDLEMEFRNITKYNAIIGQGKTIYLLEKEHVVTQEEEELLYAIVNILKGKFYEILKDNKIDMGDLE